MSQSKHLLNIRKTWILCHFISAISVLVLILLGLSSLNTYISLHIEQPFLFKVREVFSGSPKLYDKLKIIAYDDLSFSFYGGPRLPTSDLFTLIDNLEKRKPKAILIDSLLSDNISKSPDKTMKPNGSVYSGAYLNAYKIPYRQAYSHLEKKSYSLNKKDAVWINRSRRDWQVYAHSNYYDSFIADVGHLTYNDDGTIAPYFAINSEKSIPHISLYAADSVKTSDKALFLDGNQVPLDNNGNIQINFRPAREFYKQAKSLKFPMERARRNIPEKFVSEDDIVLILLNFYTGNTDFHETAPFGQIPGALLIASMISDLKSNSWIQKIDQSWFFIVFFALIGGAIGILSKSFLFLISFVTIIIISMFLTSLLFIEFSVMLPWFLAMTSFITISLTYYIHARLLDEIKYMETEEYLKKMYKKLKGKTITPFSTDQFNLLRSSAYKSSQSIHQAPNKKYFYKLRAKSLKNTNYEVFSVKQTKKDYFVIYQCDSSELPELINFCILTELNSGIETSKSVEAILSRIHNVAKTFKEYPIKLMLIEVSEHTLRCYSWGKWKNIYISSESRDETLESDVINKTSEALVNTNTREELKSLIVMFESNSVIYTDKINFSNNLVDEISIQTDGSFFIISF